MQLSGAGVNRHRSPLSKSASFFLDVERELCPWSKAIQKKGSDTINGRRSASAGSRVRDERERGEESEDTGVEKCYPDTVCVTFVMPIIAGCCKNGSWTPPLSICNSPITPVLEAILKGQFTPWSPVVLFIHLNCFGVSCWHLGISAVDDVCLLCMIIGTRWHSTCGAQSAEEMCLRNWKRLLKIMHIVCCEQFYTEEMVYLFVDKRFAPDKH